MKGLTKFVIATIALGTALNVHATENVDLNMTVSEVTVAETDTLDFSAARAYLRDQKEVTSHLFAGPAEILGAFGSLSEDPSSITAWVTIGKKVWAFIVANKPVVNVSTQKVSVLPAAQTDWRMMSNWNPRPFAKTYVLEAKNGYGMKVIKHAYTVAFNYGGKYNGKGAFIANATIIPSKVEVAWGYKLNSKVVVGDAINTGSLENPIPAINLELQYSIDTVVKHASGRDNVFIRGNGSVQRLTN